MNAQERAALEPYLRHKPECRAEKCPRCGSALTQTGDGWWCYFCSGIKESPPCTCGLASLLTPSSHDRRCRVTGNLCGTDTWQKGFPCRCEACQAWLALTPSSPEQGEVEIREIVTLLMEALESYANPDPPVPVSR